MIKTHKIATFVLALVIILVFYLSLITTPNAWAEDLNANFEDNSLLIVLTREATLLCKTYSPAFSL